MEAKDSPASDAASRMTSVVSAPEKTTVDATHQKPTVESTAKSGAAEKATVTSATSATSSTNAAGEAKSKAESESIFQHPAKQYMTYEAATSLRSLCLAQGEIESHAACLLARVSSVSTTGDLIRTPQEQIAEQIARHTEAFLAAGGSQCVLDLALAQVKQGIQDVLACRPAAEKNLASLDALYSLPHEAAARMARNCGRYWTLHRNGNDEAAKRAQIFISQAFHRCHWTHAAWRGANLGGWFLLEPGPASPLYETVKAQTGRDFGESEWDLCAALDAHDSKTLPSSASASDGACQTRKARVLDQHRATHYTGETMRRIKAAGLNAVRIPFGYWIITGPSCGDLYHGPALSALDKAVQDAAGAGLQILLDLHGCPGGENGLRPCGRAKRSWCQRDWRVEESLEVLKLVAARYKDVAAVTGIQVCNEPSPAISVGVLCDYYEAAIAAIRAAGMGADTTAIVLPIFTSWRLREVATCWEKRGNIGCYHNVAFDFHFYHDFHPAWALLSHAQHLELLEDHAREMCLLEGAMVGEWSLARPNAELTEEQVGEYAVHQVRAYNQSTHGWFFWNWHDHLFYDKWDMERGVFGRNRLPLPLAELAHEVCNESWARDPWVAPVAPQGSASRLVAGLGDVLINRMVALVDGGAAGFARRLWETHLLLVFLMISPLFITRFLFV